ncbi:radical SAM-linked protein [Aequitasia blattaphilus]|uniref:TIGR03936 family radical SAM-associated protein n=1 Tax=Aequitasia blattaphilus TaxID=2949332 RepID=A0ABT1E670_9FIRM|nr:TIGR03936 family radical SAM-associated protein [Aequitasia blattaphilus]MCP1101079.1 TIGR03936 family radical SAM-associated protein [Aequitasia blattaphilus]MCR8613719.1 TIGR03936 family radical SAM-associated protein [Aequitasia blattaphilus]
MKARIKFRKYGAMRYIGHLDLMRFFQKAMRRGRIPVALTQGYSPHFIMSFAQPLSVGLTSDGEYMDVELTREINLSDAIRDLNEVMVEGVEIANMIYINPEKKYSGMTMVAAADYLVKRKDGSPIATEILSRVDDFMAKDEISILKKTKRSEKIVNIRPFIFQMEEREGDIYLFLAAGSETNLKPDLVMKAFDPENLYGYHRLNLYGRNENDLLPLEAFVYEESGVY